MLLLGQPAIFLPTLWVLRSRSPTTLAPCRQSTTMSLSGKLHSPELRTAVRINTREEKTTGLVCFTIAQDITIRSCKGLSAKIQLGSVGGTQICMHMSEIILSTSLIQTA